MSENKCPRKHDQEHMSWKKCSGTNIQEPNVREPNVLEPNVWEPNVQEPNVQEPNVRKPNVRESNVGNQMGTKYLEIILETNVWEQNAGKKMFGNKICGNKMFRNQMFRSQMFGNKLFGTQMCVELWRNQYICILQFYNWDTGIVWSTVELSLLQTSSSYSRSVELANSCWIMHLYISLLYVHLAWYYCETLRNFCRNLRTRPEQNLLEQ